MTSSTFVSDRDPPEPTNFAGSIEVDLVSRGDPHEIMERLVRFAAENVQVDRCTLTSLDQDVLRVEASYEPGRPPEFVGHEYPMSALTRQPLLEQAVTTGAIVLGGSLSEGGGYDPDLAPSLLAIRHTAIVPLAVGETVGAVLILSRRSDRPFVPLELEGLQQVGLLAVLALRNARLVDRLEAHAGRMAELEQQKSEFLQLASHELRGPITLVSGYLSMLEEGSLGDLPAPAAKAVPLMSARMRHMSALVDGMLTTSRMEIRARGQNTKEMSLDALARAVAASARTHGAGRAARTVTVQSAGRVRVRADPEQVETILGNLVSNALKYSPAGGDVIVVVRVEPGWAAVDVTDHGDGIAEADLPRLFQPFGRLPNAVAAGIQGTGLGLHLSRGLAQAQGGDIEVTSRPGAGSTFTLRLPRGRQRSARAGRQATRTPHTSSLEALGGTEPA